MEEMKLLQTDDESEEPTKIILLTKFGGSVDMYDWQYANDVCSKQCYFTNDMSAMTKSEAVIFHGNNHEVLRQNLVRPSPEQLWIWLNLEPPTGYEPDPDETSRLKFNWTFTYRADSDIFAPYSRVVPVRDVTDRMWRINNLLEVPESLTESTYMLPSLDGFSERKMAAWIVSHCETFSKREVVVSELSKLIPVDIYGSCGDKQCKNSRQKLKRGDECRREIHRNYKFYLAFENALCDDYVTEKFFDTLKFEMIPVVYGSTKYSDRFPPNSFINVLDYETLKDLANHLRYVADNPQAWLKYFEWKQNYRVIYSTFLLPYCELCDKLIYEENPVKSYKDISRWWLLSESTGKLFCRSNFEVEELISKLSGKNV